MEWISVKDRLPEEKSDVLIITQEEKMAVAYLCTVTSEVKTWDLSDVYWLEFKEVTHWMPLPERPKE